MSEHSTDPVSKLAKLNTSDDYILYKRRVFAYIRKHDCELLCFEDEPANNSASARKKWFECMMRAKSTIVLCLGDTALAKIRKLIDDDKISAKNLLDKLGNIYTASDAQSVLHLRQEMDDFRYEEGKSWDDHVNKFMELLSKRATYDQELTEKEKASKLLRSLQESFGGFAMIAQIQELESDRLIQAMQAKISRRHSVRASISRDNPDQALKAANASQAKNGKKGSHFFCRIGKQSNECYVCGKIGHFARDCWYKANGNGFRGRGRGTFRGNRGHGRGRGRGRGRGGFFPSRTFFPGFRNSNTENHTSWRDTSGNSRHLSNPYSINNSSQPQPPQANFQLSGHQEHLPNSDPNMPFRGFMAKMKRSKLSSINTTKTDNALIDSGATHFFFHSVRYFKDYRKIQEEDVQSASGVSRIVGMGTVFIPVDGGVYFEAYHAPEFGENILLVSKLSRVFTLEFSTDDYGEQSTCFISSKQTGKLVFKRHETDGLYKMHVPKLKPEPRPPQSFFTTSADTSAHLNGHPMQCIVCSSAAVAFNGKYRPTSILHNNKPLQWHFRTGHPNPTRYSQLAQIFPDVPYFPRSTLDDIFCIPCQQGKTRRAAVLPTPMNVTTALELVHMDISGPVLPSLSGSTYALSIMDSRTAKSDRILLEEEERPSHMLDEIQSTVGVTKQL